VIVGEALPGDQSETAGQLVLFSVQVFELRGGQARFAFEKNGQSGRVGKLELSTDLGHGMAGTHEQALGFHVKVGAIGTLIVTDRNQHKRLPL
jgi:hypothetical protein